MIRGIHFLLALSLCMALTAPCQENSSTKDFQIADFTVHVINNKGVPVEVTNVELAEDAKWPENISITHCCPAIS